MNKRGVQELRLRRMIMYLCVGYLLPLNGRNVILTNITAAEGDKGDLSATQDDLARVIESIRLRDQRIMKAEAELRALKQDLDRISDENRKMREEALPIMRLMKDQRTPLPDPAGGTIPSPRDTDPSKLSENLAPVKESKGSSLSRKFSTKKLFLGSAPKQTSPTHPPRSYTPQPREVRDDTGTHLEASAAAMAASSHLTASMTAQTSPNGLQSQQLSPTSPAYSNQPSSAGSYHNPPGSAAGRNFPREATRHDRGGYGHTDDTGTGFSSQASTLTSWPQTANDQASIRREERDRARRQAPTPSPRDDEGMRERDRGDRYVLHEEVIFRLKLADKLRKRQPPSRNLQVLPRSHQRPLRSRPTSRKSPLPNLKREEKGKKKTTAH